MWMLPVLDEVAPVSYVLPYDSVFEGGTVDGWTANGTVTVANSAAQAYKGTKSLSMAWNGSLISVRRTVANLTIGKQYRFSAAVYVGRSAGVGGSVGIGIVGMTVGAVRSSWNNAWGKLGYTFIATATSHQLEISVVAATTGTDYLDDVRLDPIPIAIPDESSEFEGGTVGDWAGSSGASVANTAVRARRGQRSLNITWPTVAANGAGASVSLAGGPLTIGKTYYAFADAWIPSGSPKIRLTFINNLFPYYGVESSTNDTWQSLTTSIIPTSTEEIVTVRPFEAATAGQQCYIDGVEVGTMPIRKEDQSFENGSVGGWFSTDFFGNYDYAGSLTNSTVRASDGQRSLLVTWGAPGSKGVQNALVYIDCLVAGQTYIWEMDVYVPSGSPHVRIQGLATGYGEFSTVKDQWTTIRQIWYCDAANTYLGVAAFGAAAGNQVWIDNFRCTEIISKESRSFEAGSVGDWVVGGSVPPTIANSATRSHAGTKSMLLTWGAGGSFPLAQLTVPTTIGEKYTFSAWVWVPTGSPGVATVVGSVIGGNTGGLRDQWVQISSTFIATGATRALQIWPTATASAGNTVYIDDVQVVRVNPIIDVEGSTFEGGTTGEWVTNTFWGQPAATLSNSSTRAYVGTKSLLITWPATTNGSWVVKEIKTVPGQIYTVYCWVYVPTGSPEPHLSVPFKYSGATATTFAKDQWVCLRASFTADQVTDYVALDLDPGTTSAGTQCWVDNVQVYEGVEERRNIWKNPTGNVDTSFWHHNAASGGAATLTRVAPDGSLMVDGRNMPYIRYTYTAGATSNNQNGPAVGYSVDRRLPIEPGDVGKYLTYSAYVRESQVDRTSNLWFRFFVGGTNASLGGPLTTVIQTGGLGWLRITGTALIPATADHARIIYEAQGGTLIQIGDTVDIGACLVEISPTVNAYFDGNTTDVTKLDYRWEGTADASQSLLIGPAPLAGVVSMTAASNTVVGGVKTTAGAMAMTTPSVLATNGTANTPTFVIKGGTIAEIDSGNDLTVFLPGTATNDWNFIFVTQINATGTITTPGGWSSWFSTQRPSGATDVTTGMYYKKFTAGDPTFVIFNSPSNAQIIAFPFCVTGSGTSSPIDINSSVVYGGTLYAANGSVNTSSATSAALNARVTRVDYSGGRTSTVGEFGSWTPTITLENERKDGSTNNAGATNATGALHILNVSTDGAGTVAGQYPHTKPQAAGYYGTYSILLNGDMRYLEAAGAPVGYFGTVAMTAPSVLTPAGVVFKIYAGAVSMTAPSVTTIAAVRATAASASMSAPSTLTSAAVPARFGTQTMTAPSALVAAATTSTQAAGAASMTAPSTLVAAAVPTRFALQAMTAPSVLTPSALGSATYAGAVAMTALSTLTPNTVPISFATQSMTAPSSLTAAAIPIRLAAVSMTAASVLASAEVRLTYATQAMLAPSALVVAAVRTTAAAVGMTANSVLTVAATAVGASGVQMFGPSTLTAGSSFTAFATVTMTAPSILTAAAVRVTGSTVIMTAPSTLLVAGLRTALPFVVMAAPSLLGIAGVRQTFAVQTMLASSTLNIASEGEVQGIVTMFAPAELSTAGSRYTDAAVDMLAVSVLAVQVFVVAKAIQAMETPSVLSPLEVRITAGIQAMFIASVLRVNAVKFTPTGSPFWFWDGDQETPLSAWYWTGTVLVPFTNFEVT